VWTAIWRILTVEQIRMKFPHLGEAAEAHGTTLRGKRESVTPSSRSLSMRLAEMSAECGWIGVSEVVAVANNNERWVATRRRNGCSPPCRDGLLHR